MGDFKNADHVSIVEKYSDGMKEQKVEFSSDLLLPLVKGTASLKPGTPQINPIQEMENKLREISFDNPQASSSLRIETPDKTGGIDFRALPMTIQPMGSFRGLDFNLPRISAATLEGMDTGAELAQIRNMAASGIIPAGARVKELVAACAQKGELDEQADDLLVCLADIMKLEEEAARESSPELKEALVIIDSLS